MVDNWKDSARAYGTLIRTQQLVTFMCQLGLIKTITKLDSRKSAADKYLEWHKELQLRRSLDAAGR